MNPRRFTDVSIYMGVIAQLDLDVGHFAAAKMEDLRFHIFRNLILFIGG